LARGKKIQEPGIGRTNSVPFSCPGCDPPLTYSVFNEPFHDPRGRFWYVRWKQPLR
jgi:hypothetical protein